MHYARFREANGEVSHGVIHDEFIEPVAGSIYEIHQLLDRLLPISSIQIIAPCQPSKIVGVGANYHSLLKSRQRPKPEQPRIFLKPPSSIIGTNEAILLPNSTDNVVFEGELGVVIGKKCFEATKENALSFVFGYTCLNDVTDSSMIETDGPWDRGKGNDTFCPIGPVISTAVDPFNLIIKTVVDDIVKQRETTADMVFDVPTIISFISQYMTLYPGDIIATGSPAGVDRLYAGQEISVMIDGIGTLHNMVKLRA